MGISLDRILTTDNMALAGTLNVSLMDGFMPTLGGMFDLFDWGTKSGTFSAVNLPALTPGLSWDTSQLYTTGVLSVATAVIPGDYNNNGIVDAADYTVWRDKLGSSITLPNDTTPGTVTQADYDVWKNNFGASGSTAGQAGAVPEPASWMLGSSLCLVFFGFMQLRDC